MRYCKLRDTTAGRRWGLPSVKLGIQGDVSGDWALPLSSLGSVVEPGSARRRLIKKYIKSQKSRKFKSLDCSFHHLEGVSAARKKKKEALRSDDPADWN